MYSRSSSHGKSLPAGLVTDILRKPWRAYTHLKYAQRNTHIFRMHAYSFPPAHTQQTLGWDQMQFLLPAVIMFAALLSSRINPT